MEPSKRRGRMVNTSASYSRDIGFDSRLLRRNILSEIFRGFPQYLQANTGIVP
jgi:hypothetical protein